MAGMRLEFMKQMKIKARKAVEIISSQMKLNMNNLNYKIEKTTIYFENNKVL
jgi:hypothetical protein